MATYYSLRDVLLVASIHPFYSQVQYPPTPEEIAQILDPQNEKHADLHALPLTHKDDLYKQIQRLSSDDDPRNDFRRSVYTSITGGGSGGVPMIFATDSTENRRHRFFSGRFLSTCGLVDPRDWILTVHVTGGFYRSLDLLSEMFESAGGSVLAAGHTMPVPNVVDALIKYRVNVLSGGSSQILQVINYIASLKQEKRDALKINKIVFTSEVLGRPQRDFIRSVLGPVNICSVLGSAEAGPWAVANLALTGEPGDDAVEFIYDMRTMVIEVLPLEATDSNSAQDLTELPQGSVGVIVQTSLQRLRNPLVRYITGDVGSLHPLSASVRDALSTEEAPYLRMIRIRGRDKRFSFKWVGRYFEFHTIRETMRTSSWGVLQWQLILSVKRPSPEVILEVRLLRATTNNQISEEELIKNLKEVFVVVRNSEHLFKVTFVGDDQGFILSSTGNKVMSFVDKSVPS